MLKKGANLGAYSLSAMAVMCWRCKGWQLFRDGVEVQVMARDGVEMMEFAN